MTFQKCRTKLRRQSALTLVEMMVATTLLVVIMLGLTMMFNQTSRAFRGGIKQVDVFEGGRAVMDLITRDLEQMRASDDSNYFTAYGGLPPFGNAPVNNYLIQNTLPGSDPRTNVLHALFLLNHSTSWKAIGYRVLDSDTNQLNSYDSLKIGTLYRFASRNDFSDFNTAPEDYYSTFLTKSPKFLYDNGYLSRIINGVVHFRVQFYDATGHLISLTNNPSTNSIIVSTEVFPNEWATQFRDTLPAMVEVELGILEPQTLKQAESIPNDPPTFARTEYLKNQAGKVHIFRQQIQIRNAPR